MIIFYNKKTGDIVGSIEGRVHGEDHLRMWVGDREENGRIVCDWVTGSGGVFAPSHPQKEVFYSLDRRETSISDYRVDTATKELIRR